MNLKSLTQPELAAIFKELGQPAFRSKQVFTWLHKGVRSYEEMTNLPKALRELLAEKIEPGVVWNVNFPALKNRLLMGILRDRPVAPVSMYQETYIESIGPDGTVCLNCHGIPTPDSMVPVGTDVEAVRQGYISIGKVRAF